MYCRKETKLLRLPLGIKVHILLNVERRSAVHRKKNVNELYKHRKAIISYNFTMNFWFLWKPIPKRYHCSNRLEEAIKNLKQQNEESTWRYAFFHFISIVYSTFFCFSFSSVSLLFIEPISMLNKRTVRQPFYTPLSSVVVVVFLFDVNKSLKKKTRKF